jgi:DNA-binding response OmpR family regulator
MKWLIIEDEYFLVNRSFEYLNLAYFANAATLKNIEKSQDSPPMDELLTYDWIFIDISLHKSSVQDGYFIAKGIGSHRKGVKPKIVIMTGSDSVEAKLAENGLSGMGISVLKKPISYRKLKDILGLVE